jgi:hypothetical protein
VFGFHEPCTISVHGKHFINGHYSLLTLSFLVLALEATQAQLNPELNPNPKQHNTPGHFPFERPKHGWSGSLSGGLQAWICVVKWVVECVHPLLHALLNTVTHILIHALLHAVLNTVTHILIHALLHAVLNTVAHILIHSLLHTLQSMDYEHQRWHKFYNNYWGLKPKVCVALYMCCLLPNLCVACCAICLACCPIYVLHVAQYMCCLLPNICVACCPIYVLPVAQSMCCLLPNICVPVLEFAHVCVFLSSATMVWEAFSPKALSSSPSLSLSLSISFSLPLPFPLSLFLSPSPSLPLSLSLSLSPCLPACLPTPSLPPSRPPSLPLSIYISFSFPLNPEQGLNPKPYNLNSLNAKP